ncbi:uncharacterized protein CMU_007280 [Cryptosporidium muris RN66]|uniref:Uncharacterized protein n=1 Tax=Cryptosporidium muris (strain RN66) TaxID=441375 RepID=B6ADE8_CRYMR|nr:uncharacterized protein CMU_007280 [Cryptosporidium muris RN66]EEA06239.1 hypothetical protein, conserved [Cryptosporidium muris RN66]|eukprot:XP_002140588.1 hypothetical protein [Cryptosporidium muris RN66]
MDEIRRQIESLMGEIESPIEKKSVHDESVCKLYLCGLCPHELFENTKLYMGACPKIHSEKLRERYLEERKSPNFIPTNYEQESYLILQGMVDECNKKITRNRVRAQLSGSSKLEDENIKSVDREITLIMKEIEDLGASGDIDGSLKKMEDLTRLNQQKLKIIATREEVANGMYQQKLHPCEVCAAFLSETDNDQRLNDHFSGKIHLGYLAIRKQAKDLREWIKLNAATNYDDKTEYRFRRENKASHRYKHSYYNRGIPFKNKKYRNALREYDPIRRSDKEISQIRRGNIAKKKLQVNEPIIISEFNERYSLSNINNIRWSTQDNSIKVNTEIKKSSNRRTISHSDGEITPDSESYHSLSRSPSPCFNPI